MRRRRATSGVAKLRHQKKRASAPVLGEVRIWRTAAYCTAARNLRFSRFRKVKNVGRIQELDDIVRQSLESLTTELHERRWTGQREREIVSLFCFGHLLRHCQASTALADPTQIGVEVAVPQVFGQRSFTGKDSQKDQVRKDIVIWRTPRATCWDFEGKPTVHPLSVLEWKHNTGCLSAYDLRWLLAYSSAVRDFVGYAVCTNWPPKSFTLPCACVRGRSKSSMAAACVATSADLAADSPKNNPAPGGRGAAGLESSPSGRPADPRPACSRLVALTSREPGQALPGRSRRHAFGGLPLLWPENRIRPS